MHPEKLAQMLKAGFCHRFPETQNGKTAGPTAYQCCFTVECKCGEQERKWNWVDHTYTYKEADEEVAPKSTCRNKHNR